MEKLICEKCGKEIEGYTKKHVKFLLAQHNLMHAFENGKENKKQKS